MHMHTHTYTLTQSTANQPSSPGWGQHVPVYMNSAYFWPRGKQWRMGLGLRVPTSPLIPTCPRKSGRMGQLLALSSLCTPTLPSIELVVKARKHGLHTLGDPEPCYSSSAWSFGLNLSWNCCQSTAEVQSRTNGAHTSPPRSINIPAAMFREMSLLLHDHFRELITLS